MRVLPYFNRNIIAAVHDACMAGISFVLALYLRFGSDTAILAAPYLGAGTLIFTAIAVTVFVSMRLYRGLWRYASLEDLLTLTKAVTLSILVFAFVLFFVSRLEGMPRSVLIIDWLLLLVLLGGPRFLYRALKDRSLHFSFKPERRAVPLLLIGAGDNAEVFIREVKRDRYAPYHIVGIVDDNVKRIGRSIHGVRIYGDTKTIPSLVRHFKRAGKAPQRLIVTRDYTSEQLQHFLEVADTLGLTLGRLPRLSEFKHGINEPMALKPIAIEDLLGRAQNIHDREVLKNFVSGKRVLITGAGGSIGGELSRQIAQCGPKELILLELSEYALYLITQELAEAYPALTCRAVLGDVCNEAQGEELFKTYRPELVFHAAAIKHVPIAEEHPIPAIMTNVFGTRSIAEACIRHRAQAMVLISTDKAVNPSNVMGATKRLAESVCQALAAEQRGEKPTQFVTVRFGNVLGSTGSVVPLFQRQLAKGGPLTVTHPDMTRYFMTIREAVELVIVAAAMGSEDVKKSEHIFVLDMGRPVRILDLARQMIRLSGLRPEEDIQIVFTGLRPGEKLTEELFYSEEAAGRTAHQSILRARAQPAEWRALKKSLDLLRAHCTERNARDAVAAMRALVPEYRHLHPIAA